jgi:polyisoprenoid-binding protein YceI
MTLAVTLALLRMVGYAGVAVYALKERRWYIWFTFTALTFSTYAYQFTGFSNNKIEIIRTFVGVCLIYITIRRK